MVLSTRRMDALTILHHDFETLTLPATTTDGHASLLFISGSCFILRTQYCSVFAGIGKCCSSRYTYRLKLRLL